MFNTEPKNKLPQTAAVIIIHFLLLTDNDTFQEEREAFGVTLLLWACVFAGRTPDFGED